jgi:RND family efflux transporter MFP subunit
MTLPMQPSSACLTRSSRRGAAKAPLVLVLGGLLLAALLVLGLMPKLKAKSLRSEAHSALSEPRAVYVAAARKASGASEIALPGTVQPLETAGVFARTTGFVREYLVDIGDHVKAGTVLAILETPEVEADAQSAKARANESVQNQRLSRVIADRARVLAEQGISSQAEADQSEAQANSAAAKVDTTRADVSRVNTLLGFRQVRAPFDGVITKRNVERGTLVTAGSTSAVLSLFEVSKTDTLKVRIDVPQSLASSIRVGDAAVVRSESAEATGRISRTAGALDPITRTLRVEVALPGSAGILAGSFVRVVLTAANAAPPILVPANALSPRSDGIALFVVDAENRAQLRKVELGRELGVDVELRSGVEDGDQVIKNPPENLASGETVRPLTEPVIVTDTVLAANPALNVNPAPNVNPALSVNPALAIDPTQSNNAPQPKAAAPGASQR